MTNHFSHVHWGFDNGGQIPTGGELIKNSGPPESVLTPDEVAELQRLLGGEA